MLSDVSSRSQDSIREHRIRTSRIALNAREVGQGPVAIFMHGITAVGAVWDPVLDKVKGALRAVAIDQRGHGLSEKPASGYAAKDFSEDVLALIEMLGGGPAILVGHSLGARNGVVAATLRPDLVRCVIAIDFAPYIETEVLDTLAVRVNGGDRAFASQQEVEDYLQNRYLKLPPDAVRRRAEHGYHAVGGHIRPLADPGAMSQTADGLRDDLEPAFRAVTRPVLLVRGAQSKLLSAEAFAKTQQLRPDMPTLVVEDADHYVPEEAPDVIANAILDFARKH
ncbi:alpha/beta hydrolase [Pseudorhodoplanes sp.]|uniref:alpha/beta fold hydrolase n=1 Tax=Pseudorhodoplanes sp. TaxID=1934341 RepID=UPI002CC357C8|nr:alpha/beta hydrolase [Pseudorhodoplanes sp.]HWV55396.1 alpha/beta hydrolase [Pseudorhodoplanes sp.]